MCADEKHTHPPTWREGIRNTFTNWNQPLPLRTKVRLTIKNIWIRLSTRSTCCGNHGEPGC